MSDLINSGLINSGLICREALLEAHQDLVAFGIDTTFAVRNLITNAPAINSLQNCDAQGEPVAYIHKHYLNEDKNALDWHKREHPQFEMISLYTTQPQTVKDALEKAAKICDELEDKCNKFDRPGCGDAIRALIEKE